MIFTEIELKGAYLIEPEKLEDERGFFARSFCKKEFVEHDLLSEFVQCDFSYNKERGTLRGMHYQEEPYSEVKVVSCIRGAIYDVILDLRKDSETFGRWFSVELTAENYKMLYIPKGFAHGFQTLVNDSIVYYQMGEFYQPKSARGVRYDDERFKIVWPIEEIIISKKDRNYE